MPVSRVSCRYPGPRESVHIKLLVSPVSFSHNNVRLLMVYIVLTESLLTVRLAVSEIKPVQSQTDRRTDRRTDRIVNYSNSRCACARGLIMSFSILYCPENIGDSQCDGKVTYIGHWCHLGKNMYDMGI